METAVKDLCLALVNLLQADIALTMLLNEIDKMDSHPFRHKLLEALIISIIERRNVNYVILPYLKYGTDNPNVHHSMEQLSSLSESRFIDILVDLYTRSQPKSQPKRKKKLKRLLLLMNHPKQLEFSARIKTQMKTRPLNCPSQERNWRQAALRIQAGTSPSSVSSPVLRSKPAGTS